MGTGSFSADTPTSQNIDIEIDIKVISKALMQNPEFMNTIAIMVRNMLTKDVRRMGNLFANTGSRQLNNQTILPPTALNTNIGKRLS
jgi:hypothetical protein